MCQIFNRINSYRMTHGILSSSFSSLSVCLACPTHNIVTFFLSQRKNRRAFAPFQKEEPTAGQAFRNGPASLLKFPLEKARPTFLKKIFSFCKGQTDRRFGKKYLALVKDRPMFWKKIYLALVKDRPTFLKKIYKNI